MVLSLIAVQNFIKKEAEIVKRTRLDSCGSYQEASCLVAQRIAKAIYFLV
jgi:hypothetical protein